MNKRTSLLRALENRNSLKVIAGINNFDKARVLQIAACANRINQAGNISVDISAREDIVTEVLNTCPNLPVFVSSVIPSELKSAQELGATALELGNYEALHEEGIFYTADEVYALAKEIIDFRTTALVSITIPGHLSVDDQSTLAERLAELGVDMIQTEGASLVTATNAGALGQVEKVSLSLANTIEIVRALNACDHKPFVITASGISPDTIALASASGADGVGVGKYVNKLDSELEMLSAIFALNERLTAKPKTFARAH